MGANTFKLTKKFCEFLKEVSARLCIELLSIFYCTTWRRNFFWIGWKRTVSFKTKRFGKLFTIIISLIIPSIAIKMNFCRDSVFGIGTVSDADATEKANMGSASLDWSKGKASNLARLKFFWGRGRGSPELAKNQFWPAENVNFLHKNSFTFCILYEIRKWTQIFESMSTSQVDSESCFQWIEWVEEFQSWQNDAQNGIVIRYFRKRKP